MRETRPYQTKRLSLCTSFTTIPGNIWTSRTAAVNLVSFERRHDSTAPPPPPARPDVMGSFSRCMPRLVLYYGGDSDVEGDVVTVPTPDTLNNEPFHHQQHPDTTHARPYHVAAHLTHHRHRRAKTTRLPASSSPRFQKPQPHRTRDIEILYSPGAL
ncbi:hypothetical protein E2C01_084305 [Portunus trituberculatus]|uniref:Uncharacterized protein n=1 Tax=Portunus trituberculatus TaxID=210409 RepID=A0A5B7J4G7_PORTR|nr:hypothetical protein [Portunus trituberculatus]